MSPQTSTAAVNNNSIQREKGEEGTQQATGYSAYMWQVRGEKGASWRRICWVQQPELFSTSTSASASASLDRFMCLWKRHLCACLITLMYVVCCFSLSLTPTLSLTHSLIFSRPFIFFCFAAICHSFSFSETKIMFCQQVQAESNGITKIYWMGVDEL